MALSNSKLEKLKILAFTDGKRTIAAKHPVFEAMFNPESLSETFEIGWARDAGHNASGAKVDYIRSSPSQLTLKLVLDGTGVHAIGDGRGEAKSVRERVETFLNVTFRVDGKIHEPHYLLLQWGDKKFSCRLSRVDISYTAFNRDGTPLRAELGVALISDVDAKKRAKKDKLSSPDLTHSRIVNHGDTLPLLTRAFYGSSARYLDVARFNALDDFRRLTPGQQIFFPPLAALGGGDPES